MTSPYEGLSTERWLEKTRSLIAAHPIPTADLAIAVKTAWDDIFRSRIGPARIGREIEPQPQIMGFLLHELIPIVVSGNHPGWHRGRGAEKDLHCEADPAFSIEIKTSSQRSIFANRSYAQPVEGGRSKDGYYLAVNFEAFSRMRGSRPAIMRIRFGWLDQTDWIGQRSQTGQQAHLAPNVEATKLIDITSADEA